jgi:hypothetical protein
VIPVPAIVALVVVVLVLFFGRFQEGITEGRRRQKIDDRYAKDGKPLPKGAYEL